MPANATPRQALRVPTRYVDHTVMLAEMFAETFASPHPVNERATGCPTHRRTTPTIA